MQGAFRCGWVVGLLLCCSQAWGAHYYTRVNYTSNVIGTTGAYIDDNNWSEVNANTMRASVLDQYYWYWPPGDPNGFPPSSQAWAQVNDSYTLNGPTPGEIVPVTIALDVDYEVLKQLSPGKGYYYAISTQISGTGISASGIYTETMNTYGGVTTYGDPAVSLSQTIDWEVGTTRTIQFDFNITSTGSGADANWIHLTQIHVDVGHTATIGFGGLGDGYTITSELGWTPAPEPAALGLLLPLAILFRRRR